MSKLRILGVLAGPAACVVLMGSAPALADDQQGGDRGEKNVRCNNQAFGPGTIDGNLVVPSGALCTLNGTHVTGNATVQVGPPEPSNSPTSLSSNGARIDGNVGVQRNAQFLAFAASTIGGNVNCNRCEVADVQDSTVNGSQEDHRVSEGAFIKNSHFGGSLTIQDGTDFFGTGFHIDGNTIGENLVFNRNTGPSDIFTNKIAENLICNGNAPPPIGAGNTAEHKQGQCALL